MAVIPTYQRRVSPDAAVRPVAQSDMAVAAGVQAISNGVLNIGEALQRRQALDQRESERVADALLRKQKEDAQAWTAEALSNDHIEWTDRLAQARDAAQGSASGFAGEFLKTFDATTDKALAGAPDEVARAFYKDRRLALRTSLFDQARRFEADAGMKWRDAQWDASIGNVARIAARDPEQGRLALAELRALLNDAPNQSLAQIKLLQLRDAASKAAVQGMIERNPELALRTLDGYFGLDSQPPAAPAQTPVDPKAPRGIRNHNPGNIRAGSRTEWMGATGSDGQFVTFESPEAGIRALGRNLLSYADRRGLNTVAGIIGRWAPPNENDTGSYVAAVSRATGFAPDKPLDLRDPTVMTKLASAIITHENGGNPYTAEQLQAGVSAALGRGELPARPLPLLLASNSAEPPPLPAGKAPASGNFFVDQLDPQTAWSLRNAAQADMNRLQVEAKARQADQERVAGEEVKKLTDMMRDGMAPNQATLDTARKLAVGTKWAPVLAQAEADQGLTSAFRVATAEQRQATLDAMRAQGNAQQWTPRQAQVFETLSALDEKLQKAYADDPLRAAVTQGVLPALAPLDTNNLPGMLQGLPARVQQAQAAGARTGKAESPFTADEAPAFERMLSALRPQQQAETLASMAAVVPADQMARIARQVEPKNRALFLAMQAGRDYTTQGRFTSELILAGARAMADTKAGSAGEKGDRIRQQLRADIVRYLDGEQIGMDTISGPARDQIVDAAIYIANGLEATGGKANAAQAVRLAVNGEVVTHAGKRLPLPPGVDYDQFRARLSSYPVEDLQRQFAGAPPATVEQFRAGLPQAVLQPAGDGRYFVRSGAGLVLGTNGRPVVIRGN